MDAIDNNEEKLLLVNEMLSVDPDNVDLLQLKADLVELISLNDDCVIVDSPPPAIASPDSPNVISVSSDDDDGGGEEGEICSNRSSSSNDLEITGTSYPSQCLFQYRTSCGKAILLPAIITEADDISYSILFTHPIATWMLTCKYFLDNRCTKGVDCRFNHGYEISHSQMMLYRDPDFDNLSPDQTMLYRSSDSDDLWKIGTLGATGGESIAIRCAKEGGVVYLSYSCVYPCFDHHAHDEPIIIDLIDDDTLAVRSTANESIIPWEAQSRGIGSKLMKMMGYVEGSGLGKDCQGRVEPIPIEILPLRASLDVVHELRRSKGVQDFATMSMQQRRQSAPAFSTLTSGMRLKNQRNRDRRLPSSSYNKPKKTEVEFEAFSLLNKAAASSSTSDDSSALTIISTRELARKSEKELNIHSIKIDDEIGRMETKLIKQMQSNERNQGTSLEARCLERSGVIREYVERLQSSKTLIEQQLKLLKNKKSIYRF